MTSEQANARYVNWLAHQINNNDKHFHVCQMLYQHEFVWFIPNDDNRVMDAHDIRKEFCFEREIDINLLVPYISVLEVLVALSRRLEFQTGMAAYEWAFIFLKNLGLDRYRGRIISEERQDQVHEIIDDFIWRRYSHSGDGGVFPLHDPPSDQTKVELWYQMSSYLKEMEHV